MSTTIINKPPTDELLDQRTVSSKDPVYMQFGSVRLTTGWQVFFSKIWQVVLASTLSGTTANRPTTFLWIGRSYFDTSLGAHGKPIWVASVSSSGVATWVDATSTVV